MKNGDKTFDVIVKNVSSYDKELQYYMTYAYTVIKSKQSKNVKNVTEKAVKFYKDCGFEVDILSSTPPNLNEVPTESFKVSPKSQNLNEVGIKKEIKKEAGEINLSGDIDTIVNKEETDYYNKILDSNDDIDADIYLDLHENTQQNKELKAHLETLGVDKLRTLLSAIGANPRNIKDKQKLLEMASEQDEGLILDILNFKG